MSWLVSLKILLISSGVVALALAMKLYVPLVFQFLVSNFPLIWSSCKSLLRPPYLYVVINAIIITIAASSMFHHDRPSDQSKPTPPPEPVGYMHHREVAELPQPVVYEHKEEEEEEVDVKSAVVEYEHKEEAVVKEVTSVVLIDGAPEPAVAQVDRRRRNEDVLEVSSDKWTMPKRREKKLDDIVLPASKPLVSTRFSHRKPAGSTPEGGRPLRVVSKAPKWDDTLENTWKAITEGRSIPLSRHIKKSDTWHNHGHGVGGVSVDAMSTELDDDMSAAVNKSKTFKVLTNQQQVLALTAVSSSSPAGIRLRKEPSLGQDELNRRVEAFIQKFNEDMRLQRQESLNQYMEMINRGSH